MEDENCKSITRMKDENVYEMTSKGDEDEKDTKVSFLERKQEEYSTSFSIHGLSRVLHGHTYEKIFWLICLLMAIGFSGYLVQRQIVSYIEKETYIDEQTKLVDRVVLPTVTICANTHYTTHEYCDLDVGSPFALNSITHLPCPLKQMKTDKKGFELKINEGVKYNAVPEFLIYCPSFARCFAAMKEWKPVMGAPCIQWNGDSNLKRRSGKISFQLTYNSPKEIAETKSMSKFKMFVHDSKEIPHLFGDYLEMSALQNINIRFSKSVTKKLPAPYPSKCVTEENSKKYTIFPGKYTIEACIATLKCIQALKTCGVTFDYCQLHIPSELMQKYYQPNRTIEEVLDKDKCLQKFEDAVDSQQCAEPCHKVNFKPDWMITTPLTSTGTNRFTITLQISDTNSYIYREEKALFTFIDLLGFVGGTVGLFCGFSILSIFELVLFVLLRLIFGIRRA